VSARIGLRQNPYQMAFRRSYADAPQAVLSPEPQPKRRFRVLRWLWRLTYLSALGFLGFLGYNIYDLRNPADQIDPDPSKKTLVILGKLSLPFTLFAARSPRSPAQAPVGAQSPS
jgi:NADH:ubiquinone reductase (non-electrogenic)